MMSGIKVVSAAIVDSLENPAHLLTAQRAYPPSLAGLWEFPGGKVEPHETVQEALLREIHEELAIRIRLGSMITAAEGTSWKSAAWPLKQGMSMCVWLAEITSSSFHIGEAHQQVQWNTLDHSLLQLPWIPANVPIVKKLLSSLTGV